ncbi:unnamed protein product [Eruca vesicaria subsp. sativa]|uniref:Uncharacterized protein n=1 Tax=Eruca vesicaria subsp. sativa TaxID=29727 RepID=A0ABC8L8X1_ERUVS|nr:unnamed protein product [Eruca vesicaria subsp. sativa]
MDPNCKHVDTCDLETFDPNFMPLNTCDLETQGLLASLGATADAADDDEAEDLCSGGNKQERKRRLIEVGSDDDEVEITAPPTQSSQPRKQFSFGSGIN